MGAGKKAPSRIAVFDIDGTLLKGTWAEFELYRFLRRKGIIGVLQWVSFGAQFFLLLPKGLGVAFRENKGYLSGLRVSEVRHWMPAFFQTYLEPLIPEEFILKMKQFRRAGYEVILLSGTLDVILDILRDYLPVDGVIGSVLQTRNGRLTGRIQGMHPYGEKKVRALKDFLGPRSVDFSSSYAFADRFADVPLMELFGHPVAVNPDRRLRAYAQRLGWEILEF